MKKIILISLLFLFTYHSWAGIVGPDLQKISWAWWWVPVVPATQGFISRWLKQKSYLYIRFLQAIWNKELQLRIQQSFMRSVKLLTQDLTMHINGLSLQQQCLKPLLMWVMQRRNIFSLQS